VRPEDLLRSASGDALAVMRRRPEGFGTRWFFDHAVPDGGAVTGRLHALAWLRVHDLALDLSSKEFLAGVVFPQGRKSPVVFPAAGLAKPEDVGEAVRVCRLGEDFFLERIAETREDDMAGRQTIKRQPTLKFVERLVDGFFESWDNNPDILNDKQRRKADLAAHMCIALQASRNFYEDEGRKVTLDLNVTNGDGVVVDAATAELTRAQLSDIVDHASQLVLLARDGKDTADVLAELDEALCVADVIAYQDAPGVPVPSRP
jgi:hypothetical protein